MLLPGANQHLHFGSAVTINCMHSRFEETHLMDKREGKDMTTQELPFAAGLQSNDASLVQEENFPG